MVERGAQMSDWTPTTKQVREQFTREEPPRIGTVAEKSRAFNRWLEQVKAEAWDEGHHAGQHNEHEYRPGRAMTNPYRQESQA